MTVTTGRSEITEPGVLTLDELFDRLERMPVPEGYKVEIVEDAVHLTPQRWTHWDTIRKVLRQLEEHFGESAEIDSDVRIDFPGHLNGFAPDLVKIADDATPTHAVCSPRRTSSSSSRSSPAPQPPTTTAPSWRRTPPRAFPRT